MAPRSSTVIVRSVPIRSERALESSRISSSPESGMVRVRSRSAETRRAVSARWSSGRSSRRWMAANMTPTAPRLRTISPPRKIAKRERSRPVCTMSALMPIRSRPCMSSSSSSGPWKIAASAASGPVAAGPPPGAPPTGRAVRSACARVSAPFSSASATARWSAPADSEPAASSRFSELSSSPRGRASFSSGGATPVAAPRVRSKRSSRRRREMVSVRAAASKAFCRASASRPEVRCIATSPTTPTTSTTRRRPAKDARRRFALFMARPGPLPQTGDAPAAAGSARPSIRETRPGLQLRDHVEPLIGNPFSSRPAWPRGPRAGSPRRTDLAPRRAEYATQGRR